MLGDEDVVVVVVSGDGDGGGGGHCHRLEWLQRIRMRPRRIQPAWRATPSALFRADPITIPKISSGRLWFSFHGSRVDASMKCTRYDTLNEKVDTYAFGYGMRAIFAMIMISHHARRAQTKNKHLQCNVWKLPARCRDSIVEVMGAPF